MSSQGLGKLAIYLIKKIKSLKRSWQVAGSFHKKFLIVISLKTMKCLVPKAEDSRSSDKPNPFRHNFNDLHEIN